MTNIAATNSSSESPEAVKPAPDKKADAAPPPPKIGWIERATRIFAVPVSLSAAVATFHGMSRNGVKAKFETRGKLNHLIEIRDKAFEEADKHWDRIQLGKELGKIEQNFEKEAAALMHQEGFTNSWRYFIGNTSDNRFNILMNTGGAFSITLGLFTSIADPRNRAAISGLFRRLRGQEEQKPKNAQAQV